MLTLGVTIPFAQQALSYQPHYFKDYRMTSTRRSMLTRASVAAAAGTALGFPMIARAQQNFSWKMTSAYGKGSPFYMEGPGSATDLAKRIDTMSGGRLKIQVFGAGELIPALEGFDAVRAGTVEMNHANSYFWTGKTFAAQYFTAVPSRASTAGSTTAAASSCGTRCMRPSAWSPCPAATPACR